MRVLFDMVHPADVLFFLPAIRALNKRGDEIKILSRHKDVTCDLLDKFDLPHRPISIAGSGHFGLGMELLVRDWEVLKHARKFKPHVMLGLGGVAISHVGKILGVPSLSFYAADTAKLQTKITWPFITHLYVPSVYSGPTPEGRTTRFPGIKEMSYFHPENFQASDVIAKANGWAPKLDNFFVRVVAWRANHDIGKTGWTDETLVNLIKYLSARGKVHLSSERDLPESLSKYTYTGEKHELHHVMAKCQLYVGESATMAHEAAILGTPAIYDGRDHPGTTRDLAAACLVTALKQEGDEVLFRAMDALLAEGRVPMKAKLDGYLSTRPNLKKTIINAIDHHAKK